MMEALIKWFDDRGAVYIESNGWLVGVMPVWFQNNQPFYIAFAIYIARSTDPRINEMVKAWQAGGAVSSMSHTVEQLEWVFQSQCLGLVMGLQVMVQRPAVPFTIRGL